MLAQAVLIPHSSYHYRLPVQLKQTPFVCQGIPEEHYAAIPVDTRSPDPGVSAKDHPDLNLALRGYTENTHAHRGLVDYGGATDANAPQILSLFGDGRSPVFSRVHQVYQWDGNWPGVYGRDPITSPEITLAGLASVRGEKVYLPDRGPDIYQGRYIAMVLYADPDRITIKYTRDDSVIEGYTAHIEGICVEPRLVALYQQMAAQGRGHLPALARGQAVGRARGEEVGVVIRDNGAFMDPRSRKDWWQSLSEFGEVPQLDAIDSPWFQDRQQIIRDRLLDNADTELNRHQ